MAVACLHTCEGEGTDGAERLRHLAAGPSLPVCAGGLWMPQDPKTQVTRGFAFLEFSSPKVLPCTLTDPLPRAQGQCK